MIYEANGERNAIIDHSFHDYILVLHILDSDSERPERAVKNIKASSCIMVSDGSESRLGIDSTLTRHFLADSYSILQDESRLGLDRARLLKTPTGSDSTHHYY